MATLLDNGDSRRKKSTDTLAGGRPVAVAYPGGNDRGGAGHDGRHHQDHRSFYSGSGNKDRRIGNQLVSETRSYTSPVSCVTHRVSQQQQQCHHPFVHRRPRQSECHQRQQHPRRDVGRGGEEDSLSSWCSYNINNNNSEDESTLSSIGSSHVVMAASGSNRTAATAAASSTASTVAENEDESRAGKDGTIVVRSRQRLAHPASLPESVGVWTKSAEALLKSDEFKDFAWSTVHVAHCAGMVVVKVAFMPVTVPISVAKFATFAVVGSCSNIIGALTNIPLLRNDAGSPSSCESAQIVVHTSRRPESNSREGTSRYNTIGESTTEQQQHQRPNEQAKEKDDDHKEEQWGQPSLRPSSSPSLVEIVLDFADKVKEDIGSAVHEHVASRWLVPNKDKNNTSQEVKSGGINERILNDSVQGSTGRGCVTYTAGSTGDAPHEGTEKQDWSPKKYETSSGESSCEKDDFLDRLRLDYTPEKSSRRKKSKSKRTSSTHGGDVESAPRRRHRRTRSSKYLLRVDDLNILSSINSSSPEGGTSLGGCPELEDPLQEEEQQESLVFYIDLDPEHRNGSLSARALDQLVSIGLSIISNHPTVRMAKTYDQDPSMSAVDWKPEGQTGQVLRKIAKMTSVERIRVLEEDTLVWSGTWSQPQLVQSSVSDASSFFLARAMVRRKPREFLNLLWDNSRTSEYNNYCLGRKTVFELGGEILLDESASMGTKVVKSEGRIPFTGIIVTVLCLMHVRPLEAPDDGYVIVSRSLDSGCAGSHVGSCGVVDRDGPKNVILWGLNILRKVPNHPDLTDLTSISQVGSCPIPKFLTNKIGVMGVREFVDNVRKEK